MFQRYAAALDHDPAICRMARDEKSKALDLKVKL
jgi:hypothetical protein